MNDGFDRIFQALTQLERRIIPDAIVEGLDRAASDIVAAAQATTLYGNVTGATRAGTVAYVATAEDDGSAAIAQAARHVDALNPGRSQVVDAGPIGPHETVLVLTSPTDYLEDLVTRHGGAQDWVGPTLEANAPQALQEVAQAIGRALA